MKILSFSELSSQEFIITECYALKQDFWHLCNKHSCLNSPTKNQTILFIKDCTAVLKNKNGLVITAAKDDLLYMPVGSAYEIEFNNAEKGLVHSYVIHFNAYSLDRELINFSNNEIIAFSNSSAAGILARETANEYLKSTPSNPKMLSNIYNIIHTICDHSHTTQNNEKLEKVRLGIEILEDTVNNIPISEIAEICSMSESYFRRVFYECIGKSPAKFRIQNKIQYSKKLLQSDVISVSHIAEMLGFNDVYHFSKTFKQLTGISPGKYRKGTKNLTI